MSEKYPGGFVTYNPPTPSQTSATGIWTLSQQEQYQQAGLWPNAPSQVSRSLRFNSADSAFLYRTPTVASNRRTWTWSGWVKRGKIGDWAYLFQGSAGNPTGGLDDGTAIRFSSGNNQLVIYNLINTVSTVEVSTAALFRDPSAWYHIIVAMDTTQATSTDRVKVYVNGVQATLSAGGVYPSLNEDLYVNTTNPHLIGALSRDAGAAQLFNDGYMANVQFVDGQALTPSSFGENNVNTGVWQPLQKNLTYGTNGFQLTFNDNTNTTATTLGADSSGNGNNWTPSNFSVTTGPNNDSMVDSPTSFGTDTGVGGEVRGNYCTLNPLNTNSTITLTNGNLNVVSTGNTNSNNSQATFSITTGKWYFENTVTQSGANQSLWGFINQGTPATVNPGGSNGICCGCVGSLYVTMSGATLANSISSTTFTTNDVAMVAVDADTGKVWFGKNGTWLGSGSPSPATGTTPNVTFTANTPITPVWQGYESLNAGVFNFGQRPFAYTAPSGFKALCTQNLPTPTIGATTATQAGKFFNPVLYTGNGTARSITGVGFQPDFTWIKLRDTNSSNGLFDAVRGATKRLVSDTTAAEDTISGVTSFDSDGFSLGTSYNGSPFLYVAWNWKANGAGSTNTSGSITSTVSANTTSGFSVVTYAGNSVASTIGHGLGVAPSMIIVKNRTTSSPGAWTVYHASLGNTSLMFMNTTDAVYTGNTAWNSTSPTSSVFSVGSGTLSVNNTGNNFVAYCFAEVAGYSKFGSYTGNGSTDGPFVFTGMRPAYIMVKRTDTGGTNMNWIIWDTTRNTTNVVGEELYANLNDAGTTYTDLDILSNGFKFRNSTTWYNASGGTYIYMAFASSPFKYSLAR
jgi:hypothetical protein